MRTIEDYGRLRDELRTRADDLQVVCIEGTVKRGSDPISRLQAQLDRLGRTQRRNERDLQHNIECADGSPTAGEAAQCLRRASELCESQRSVLRYQEIVREFMDKLEAK